jgi:hypothetical protein
MSLQCRHVQVQLRTLLNLHRVPTLIEKKVFCKAGIQVYLLISVNFLAHAHVSGSRTAKSMRIRIHNTAYGGYRGAISVRKIVLLLIVLLLIVLDCF